MNHRPHSSPSANNFVGGSCHTVSTVTTNGFVRGHLFPTPTLIAARTGPQRQAGGGPGSHRPVDDGNRGDLAALPGREAGPGSLEMSGPGLCGHMQPHGRRRRKKRRRQKNKNKIEKMKVFRLFCPGEEGAAGPPSAENGFVFSSGDGLALWVPTGRTETFFTSRAFTSTRVHFFLNSNSQPPLFRSPGPLRLPDPGPRVPPRPGEMLAGKPGAGGGRGGGPPQDRAPPGLSPQPLTLGCQSGAGQGHGAACCPRGHLSCVGNGGSERRSGWASYVEAPTPDHPPTLRGPA